MGRKSLEQLLRDDTPRLKSAFRKFKTLVMGSFLCDGCGVNQACSQAHQCGRIGDKRDFDNNAVNILDPRHILCKLFEKIRPFFTVCMS